MRQRWHCVLHYGWIAVRIEHMSDIWRRRRLYRWYIRYKSNHRCQTYCHCRARTLISIGASLVISRILRRVSMLALFHRTNDCDDDARQKDKRDNAANERNYPSAGGGRARVSPCKSSLIHPLSIEHNSRRRACCRSHIPVVASAADCCT